MTAPELSDFSPDEYALLLVQQYLSENGHSDVLSALERKTGVIYDDGKVSSGSLLMQLVYQRLENAAAEHDDPEAAALKLEEESLLRGGNSDYVSECASVIEGVHTASVVAVRLWPGKDKILSGAGKCIATCSHDQSVGVHSVQLRVAGEEAGSGTGGGESTDVAAAVEGAVGKAQESLVVTMSTLHKVPFSETVSDVCFMHDGVTLVVAVRGSCFLRLLDSANPSQAEIQVNMNEQATDTHLSFSAVQLALSHCGHYLLVSTDSPRILVFATHSWKRLRVMDPNYVYAAAAGGTCIVFHVGSGKQVSTLPMPHRANVRSMHYDAERNLLATCSFDKAVKVYEHTTPL
ncbi:MAG: hypothetical protein WDW38_006729 [Sanguina aurantia]